MQLSLHPPSSRKAMMRQRGTVAQPHGSHSVKGTSVSQMTINRLVWRVSAKGEERHVLSSALPDARGAFVRGGSLWQARLERTLAHAISGVARASGHHALFYD